ncbi:MAG: plastocyanin/azurin family copper-binding protein [bacterium]
MKKVSKKVSKKISKYKIIIIAVSLLVIAVIGIVIFKANQKDSKVVVDTNKIEPFNANVKVSIKGFNYVPLSITIKKGDTVTWTNDDKVANNVATVGINPAYFDSGSIAVGKTYTHTFTATGTYRYICSYHTSMKANIIVID